MKHLRDNYLKTERLLIAEFFFFDLELHDDNYPGLCLTAICEMCSNLTIKTQEQRHSVVFVVNFEDTSSHLHESRSKLILKKL